MGIGSASGCTQTCRNSTSGGNPVTTTYDYFGDAGGELKTGALQQVTYDHDGGVTPDVSFTYDRLGRSKTVMDAVGTHTFTYDATKLHLTQERVNGSGALFTRDINRRYETIPPTPPIPPGLLAGRLKTLVVSNEGNSGNTYQTDYFYETDGQLSRVTGPGLPAYGATYNYLTNSSMLDRIDFKTNSTTTVATADLDYESNRDLLTAVTNKWGSTTVSKYAYANDDLGRREYAIRTGSAFSTAHQDQWSYNDRNELIDSNRYNNTTPYGTTNPDTSKDRAFAFDTVGNRTSYQEGMGTATTYTSNDVNEYSGTSNPSWSPSYDADGNMTSGPDRAGGAMGGSGSAVTYEWDAENRLTAVYPSSPVNGNKKLIFDYDYMGRRVRKRVYTRTAGAWPSTPSEDRRFVYDNWRPLVELNGLSSNAVVRKWTWGADLAGQSGGGVAGSGTSPALDRAERIRSRIVRSSCIRGTNPFVVVV